MRSFWKTFGLLKSFGAYRAVQRATLKALTRKFQLSITLGDLRLLDASWYVTHSGLTRLAKRSHCAGIDVRSMREYCDPASSRWVFKATVYKSPPSGTWWGAGDADPRYRHLLAADRRRHGWREAGSLTWKQPIFCFSTERSGRTTADPCSRRRAHCASDRPYAGFERIGGLAPLAHLEHPRAKSIFM